MTAPSTYLQNLPEALRDTPSGTAAPFLGEYLKIIEAMLAGRDDAAAMTGLQAQAERFAEYLDPALVPVDDAAMTPLSSTFLGYLAQWVALVLDENWDLERRRRWLQRIVPLYKRRGTAAGLTEYLHIFVGDQVRIEEVDGGIIVGRIDPNPPYERQGRSTVAVNTYLVSAPAYYFRVLINYAFGGATFDIAVWRNLLRGTRAIVDLEKPAHTYYTLHARTPGFIVGRINPNPPRQRQGRSTVAKDSLLWSQSRPI